MWNVRLHYVTFNRSNKKLAKSLRLLSDLIKMPDFKKNIFLASVKAFSYSAKTGTPLTGDTNQISSDLLHPSYAGNTTVGYLDES